MRNTLSDVHSRHLRSIYFRVFALLCWQPPETSNSVLRYIDEMLIYLRNGTIILPRNPSMHTMQRMDDFQVFVKIAGSNCNLRCSYCYYTPYSEPGESVMPDDILEIYIRRHIEASRDRTIAFSWHGGEPTLYGLDGFRNIVKIQKKYCPQNRRILNGIQTNGILLDDEYCEFFAEEQFVVGLSLDGPERCHDFNRVTANGEPTHRRVLESLARLKRYGVTVECLCVVHAENSRLPEEVYDFFRSMDIRWLTFLPLVEILPDGAICERSVSSEDWGEFLCTVFDIWRDRDIGRIQIQLFEEITRAALGVGPSLCVLRRMCGGVPVLDASGNLYCCDRFMRPEYLLGNIRESTLTEMLNSARQQSFGRAKFQRIPAQCQNCSVLDMCNGGCPKDRVLQNRDGEPEVNYLCSGFRRFFLHARPFVQAVKELYC